ncbi:MAG: hypothetical protein L6R35_000325 [Caloplaca aegaea]|nr:MAG: hypothetical protein L6R35_000325 [Caloplaca aegaea]
MDSASFEKPFFVFDNPSPFDRIVPSLFLNNDDDNSVSMEALLNDPTFSEDWQMDDAANSESSIDPALLTTFDPSLEPNTLDSMPWDPSTSTDWQPLNPYANIDPVLLALDNIQINHFDLQTDHPYNPQPFFANNNKNNNKNKSVIFPPQSLEFTASTAQAPLSPEVPRVSQQLLKQATKNAARRKYRGRPATNRRKGKWDSNPYGQPRVDGSGCPCSLCRGGAVDISSLSLRVKQQQQQKRNQKAAAKKESAKKSKTAAAARVQKKKQSHHRSFVVSPPAKGNNKRAGKRKAMVMEEDEDTSESELSDLPSLSEDDGVDAEDRALSDFDEAAPPMGKKRRRVTTTTARVGKKKVAGMPRGLEIQMRGW